MKSSGSGGWFKSLFGVEELRNYKKLQENFHVSANHDVLTSIANNRQFKIGNFSTPTLESLKSEALNLLRDRRGSVPSEIKEKRIYKHIATGDAFSMHYEHPNAVFQAASQFNCLEFPSSRTFPECGVEGYQYDRTQGPACALACAAGTVYRNYFVPVNPADKSVLGQTKTSQINNLDELGAFLENDKNEYWYIENGYTFSRDHKHLEKLNVRIAEWFNTPNQRNLLLNKVKIGLHRDVGVAFKSRFVPISTDEPEITVTQAYCSALSCAYSGVANQYWEPLARIVLDAMYEATLWAAVIHSLSHTTAAASTVTADAESNAGENCKNNDTSLTKSTAQDQTEQETVFNTNNVLPSNQANEVFLTFLGGGVFGNDNLWIAQSIGRALAIVTFHGADLKVYVCHYRNIGEKMQWDIDQSYAANMEILKAGGEV